MKQSIQKHDISNLSPLAPALRGLEDARTQRWTFCEPCSMEQNVQVQGEHCQHGKTIKHVWENAKMPKHRASKATVLTMSLDWEPRAKPDRWTQRKWFMTSSLSNKESIQTQSKRSDTVNTARLHDQWNGRLSTCLLKASLAHEKSAARWKNAKIIHLISIFNISDQGPEKFPKWVSGISKWAFSSQAEG